MDRNVGVAAGAALCVVGGGTIALGQRAQGGLGTAESLISLAVLLGGLYLVLAVLFGWPLPRGKVVLSPEAQVTLAGLRSLIDEGERLLSKLERSADYYRWYSAWVRASEKFVEEHLTSAHARRFRQIENVKLPPLPLGLPTGAEGMWQYTTRYLERLQEFENEITGRP